MWKCYTFDMSNIVEKLEIDIDGLSSKDKAALAHYLIEELDGNMDENVEEIWRKEAELRYQSYKTGKLAAISGKDVMLRARERIK